MAFAVVSEPKIKECAGTKQQLHSVQTESLLDAAIPGAKPMAATASAVAVTHFRIMSGGNSLRVSRCQTNRNKLHFIEHLPAETDTQTTFLTLQLLKETNSMRDLSLIDLFSPTKMWHVWQTRSTVSEWEVFVLGRWCYVQVLAQPLEDRGTKTRNNNFAPCDLYR